MTYDGVTPLHIAAGRGLKGQTALLVAAGANTEAENSEQETAYELATVAEVRGNIFVKGSGRDNGLPVTPRFKKYILPAFYEGGSEN